jgi:hypothetical protein
MPDAILIKPLIYDARQTPRDILPSDWADSLRLDYLGRNEAAAEIAERILLIGKAVYDLQVRIEAIENALP